MQIADIVDQTFPCLVMMLLASCSSCDSTVLRKIYRHKNQEKKNVKYTRRKIRIKHASQTVEITTIQFQNCSELSVSWVDRQLELGWVGSGQSFGGLGWAGSIQIDPQTTMAYTVTQDCERDSKMFRNGCI